MPVIEIDGTPTAIKHVTGNVAKGFVFRNFQLIPCYVVKQDDYFAHGETLKEAVKSLQEKILLDTSVEERIDAFLSEIKQDKEYKAKIFHDWHHKLTGSCEFGRNEFIKQHGIDLNDLMTVERFVELTKNSYGGDIIKLLEKRIIKQNKR